MTAGSVVLLRFPFSDLSGAKLRPVVVIASDRDEFIACQVTSKTKVGRAAIELHEDDFAEGGLRIRSFVRPGKLFTADRAIVVKRVGMLRQTTLSVIRQRVVQIIRNG